MDASTTHMSPRQRSVVNVVAIVTSLLLLAFSLWGGSAFGAAKTGESPAIQTPSLTHFFAGALGLAGVLLAQRWRRQGVGRLLLGLSAAILLVTLAMFRYFGTWAWISLIIPAALLILCAIFLRPAPPPEPYPVSGGDIRPPA
jgi:peptidoglycan/LPS O-acetylase OafA/YrhL